MDGCTGTMVPHLTGESVFRRPDYTLNLMGETHTIELTTPAAPLVIDSGCTAESFPWENQRVLATGQVQTRSLD